MYLPEISKRVLSNGDYRNLLSLGQANGGRVVGPKSLHEILQAASEQARVYKPDPLGQIQARKAITSFYDAAISAEQIVVTP